MDYPKSADAQSTIIADAMKMMPATGHITHPIHESIVAGSGSDALDGGGGGFDLGGGVSCVGWFGGRGGGAGREDEPTANCLSYSALLAGSLRTSHASFSRLVVASAVGLGFRSG